MNTCFAPRYDNFIEFSFFISSPYLLLNLLILNKTSILRIAVKTKKTLAVTSI